MRFIRNLAVLTLGVTLAACGGGGPTALVPTDDPAPPLPFSSLGELADAIEAAALSSVPEERLDSDLDSIPDVVELRLGTNPALADSDHDGLVDPFELFGPDYTRSAPLPDTNRNGLTAAADNDDDGDHVNDGLKVDTDGDGVPNYFEFYGYTFDILTGQFQLWDGNETTPHFFTDPLQPSTDQDAYPDGMEASGALLDPTVRRPGDDPLVPATPNIVFELAGYEVTLNETIQVTDSEQLSKGRTWSRETEQTYEHTSESTWEAGVEVEYSAQTGSAGWKGTGHFNFGHTWGSKNGTNTTVATGDSVTTDTGWSQARSYSPTDAARIKLFLRVVNRGTAPLSNVVPTLNLRIGGLNVATFEPAGASIAMLVPGQVYPESSSAYWVVSALASGSPLSLTMAELRALERGAPVSIVATQIRGEVMRLLPGGGWSSIGDTNQYDARCDSVCARLRIDLEDGTCVQHLVYAGDGPSSPRMTLGAGLRHLGVDDEGTLLYFDQRGTPHVRSLAGFAFAVDPDTLRANGWVPAADGLGPATAPADFQWSQMRLLPTSLVLVRAPRSASGPQGPILHYACLDAQTGEVQVSAADYRGITSVQVLDAQGAVVLALEEGLGGAGFYSGFVRMSETFDGSSALRVVATNLDGVTTEVDLGRLYQTPDPVEPVISIVHLNQVTGYLYANVESGNPDQPNSEVMWVRAFHALLPGGVANLEPVVNAFEDENGYSAVLPYFPLDPDDLIEVVAYVSPGVYTKREITLEDVSAAVYRQAESTLKPTIDIDKNILTGTSITYERALLDMDAVKAADVSKKTTGAGPTTGPTDLWVEIATTTGLVHFNMSYKKMPAGTSYSGLTKAQVVTAAPATKTTLDLDEAGGFQVGNVYAVQTTGGLYGKIRVKSITWTHNYFTSYHTATIVLQHVTWK